MTLRSDQTRRRVLALALPLSAGLLMFGAALTPKGLDKPISSLSTALKELPIAAAQPNRLYASNLLVLLGLGALCVAFSSIATLVRHRGSVFATTAAVIGGFAGFCGLIVNVLIGYNLAAAATSHTTQYAAAQVLVSANTSPLSGVLFVGYIGGLLAATVLAALALWRSRSVPRWLPILFASGLVLGALAPPGIAAIPLTVPFAAAMVILATRIWRMGEPTHTLMNPNRFSVSDATK